MEGKEALDLFHSYNQKYFWGKLDKVRLSWSKNMTLCAGKTTGKVRRGSSLCSISLSEPLLSQRPRQDTINILLHEMIHAYLFVTEGANHKMGHGPQFKEHMNRINTLQGCKITVCHNFRKEVDKFRVHVYRCDGPCIKKRPYFGVIRRAVTRPPGPTDKWWARHSQECGGTFRKVEGPDISPDTPTTNKLLKASSPAASPGTPSPKFTPSLRKMDPSKSQSSGATVKSGRSDGSKFISDKSKRLSLARRKTEVIQPIVRTT
ncbi:SprT-like domain-containing protein Spartan [Chionoecetes opilio]|uniref:SprT-like domain-containing protein Spartan n=1 Tax=Chionoecetes opilio TaxID=41210 RepID=A0A8J4Y0E3_CHIOP|nr:SprT-like domain-containing protein Spartan [Chionoecetes opilio]